MTGQKTTMGSRQLRRRPSSLSSLVASTLGTPVLTRLPPREQEIATIVYLHTNVTAKELEDALAHEVGNSAIRCMLGRLVAKGVLRRRKGQGKTFIYSPALALPDVQDRALERVAEDYFGGSLQQTMQRLLGLIQKRDPEMIHVFPEDRGIGAPAWGSMGYPLALSR